MTPRLAELQSSLQAAILDNDDAVLPLIRDSAKENRKALLGVYRNAYALRLIEALKVEYEFLHGFFGETEFTAMARAYIGAHLSRSPNIRWIGAALPDFLAATAPYTTSPVIADLARLEKALNDAFDAADSPVAGQEVLAGVPADAWGRLVIEFHPSLRLVCLRTNAAAILAAVRKGETPPAGHLLGTEARYVAWRQDGIAKFRPLEAEEAMAITSAFDKVPFAILCEMIATYADPDTAAARAAGYLAGWFQSELIASVRV